MTAVETRWDESPGSADGLVPSGGWHRPSSRPGIGSVTDGPHLRHRVLPDRLRPGGRVRRCGQVGPPRSGPPRDRRSTSPTASRPYDVRGGSLALARAIPYVPEGVVLAVVDPGVGTAARGDRRRGRRRRRRARRPRQRAAGPRRRHRRRRRAGRRADQPGVPPRRRAGRRSPVATCSRRSPPTSATASTSPSSARSLDTALLMPGMVALPREEDDGIARRGPLGRPVRQLPAQRRPRRARRRRRGLGPDGQRRAPRRAAWPGRSVTSARGRSASSWTPRGCTPSSSTSPRRRPSCDWPPATPSSSRPIEDDNAPAPASVTTPIELRRPR